MALNLTGRQWLLLQVGEYAYVQGKKANLCGLLDHVSLSESRTVGGQNPFRVTWDS